jgi:pseudaminic acid synthase
MTDERKDGMAEGIEIAGRPIGPGHPVYIVAEMSANHGGSLEHAIRVIEEAAACGADAVKLQTYTPDTMTIDCDAPSFRIGEGSLWAGRTLYDLYGEAHTPWDWHRDLVSAAGRAGITIFSTPFDATAVEFLLGLDLPAMKIASFELTDLRLIRRIAATGKPILMSTGMGTLDEIREAVETVRAAGNDRLVLLKCTSAYPAPAEDMNLRTIPDLAGTFGVPVGLSDHSTGPEVAVLATALGACVIEKHFCLSRDEGGPDSTFSMEPDDLRQLVAAVRTAESALGRVSYGATKPEKKNIVFRRSIFVVEDVAAGAVLDETNVRVIRPGYGLQPKHFEAILGRKAAGPIARGTPLSWDLIQPV